MDSTRVTLIAIKALKYAGTRVPAGGTFSASPKDARVLTAIKHAKEAPVEAPVESSAQTVKTTTHYETAALTAEPDRGPEKPVARTYRRRDLTVKP